MKKIFNLLLVVCLLSGFAFGQDTTKLFERDFWRTRADILTSNLLKDASKNDALDRALLMAQLSDLWWESDQNQANMWIEKSVDAIYFYPAEEAKAQREKFFRVTRQVLSLISAHNKKQSTRLSEILSKSEDISDNEKNLNAEALVEQALQIVKENPNKAAELGFRAFNLGFPTNAHKLSLELQRYNPALANQFFRVAFSNVSASPDRIKLYGMQYIAFPEGNNPNFPRNLKPPVELKTLFLNFVADYLSQLQIKFSSKLISSCSDEAVFAIKLKNYFTELLPQKSDIVRQAIDICLVNLSQEGKQLLAQTNTYKTSNVDELLNQADKIQNDTLFRANYLFKAATSANQQKLFAKSIQILEKMTDEERKIDTEFWEELRFDSGAGLAVAEFKEGNVAVADKTIKDIPDKLRPLAQVTFVLQFSPEDITCSQFCVELLSDARRGIVKSELPFTRKSSYWLNLVKSYSNYQLQTEAAEVFREIVVAFNSFMLDNTPTKNDAASNKLIAASKRIIPDFSPTLFETKENSIFESINLLKDEKPRTQINLEFLKMILKKYNSFKLELEKKPEKKTSLKVTNIKQYEN
jgi:hypothetical protein